MLIRNYDCLRLLILSLTLYVTDHQSPVFTESCPMYIEKTAPPGMRQAVVIFQTPVATDNSGDVNVARYVLEQS